MKDIIEFANREVFRMWLSENCLPKDSIWPLFRKSGELKHTYAN